MHSGAVDGAAKQLLKGDESVAVVQVQAAENLVRPVTQLRQEESAGRLGGRERRSDAQRLAKMPPRQLDRATPPGPGAKKQRHELGIRERVRAALEQLLPRPLRAGPVPDAHYLQF